MNEQVKTYLTTLRRYLKPLPVSEREDTYRFYEELFLDAEMSSDQIYAEFGNPKTLARQINANYAMGWVHESGTESDESIQQSSATTTRSHWHAAWLILLGVLASPILIPLAIVMILGFISAIFMVIALIFIIAGLLIGAAILGGVAIVAGVNILGQGLMMALFMIGGGILILGTVVLSIPVVIWIVYGIGWVGYRLVKWIGSLTLKRRPELKQ
ncbi:DUF1700 domain-containing protein [Weissella diestrammenae]|uniref:DUF1700 domain-containing protein n=1 Tax=Weissella diestrammenae TaxID=1162633 RepID=A0A7G9T4D2_9LACO|nr:DUF1700 domain-containing protein [Weissella diestrammenae]MCM0583493.1 DUF1700 domain-containing protein [Weissella diestrammenae]QNN74957.1 DUF1700 domain-containing protein [Weissella diestrammenae]